LCTKDEEESENTAELGLANVGGVFIVLMYGLCGSFFIAICEFLWNIRKVAVTEKVNFYFFMFIIKFKINKINFVPFNKENYSKFLCTIYKIFTSFYKLNCKTNLIIIFRTDYAVGSTSCRIKIRCEHF